MSSGLSCLTLALTLGLLDVSAIMVLSWGRTSLNNISLSGLLPSCIRSRPIQVAATVCSSAPPFFKHLSNPSVNVTFLW